ncbi:protein FAM166B-like [Protopterus annectens]|uniref:protein FAM166B-like n=1 Tax=Protopterus annectens TaxID=7888 RepID=UPI001CF99493|nr:protein FAM166B-like [Protopterus annectens]
MPIRLPQRPEMTFSTYDPNYIPGYGGFVPKLRSQIGETYGNATLRLLTYEPGQPKSSRLTLIEAQPKWNDYYPRHLLNRTYGQPDMSRYTEQFIDKSIKNGYFYPRSGKYYYALRHYMYDNNPHTTAAIETIEEIKPMLHDPETAAVTKQNSMLKEVTRLDSLQRTSIRGRPPPELFKESKDSHEVLDTSRDATRSLQGPGIFQESRGKDKLKRPSTVPQQMSSAQLHNSTSLVSDICRERPVTECGRMEDYAQNRQGRVIYKRETGIVPNYAGYVPGEKFTHGKTWTLTTENTLGIGKHKPFQRTSLF